VNAGAGSGAAIRAPISGLIWYPQHAALPVQHPRDTAVRPVTNWRDQRTGYVVVHQVWETTASQRRDTQEAWTAGGMATEPAWMHPKQPSQVRGVHLRLCHFALHQAVRGLCVR
jgi:hypothetical protein